MSGSGGWKPIHFGLAGMMLVFGSFNTLSVKWADTMTSESVDGTQKPFNHPFLQATGRHMSSQRSEVSVNVVRYVPGRDDVYAGVLVHQVESEQTT